MYPPRGGAPPRQRGQHAALCAHLWHRARLLQFLRAGARAEPRYRHCGRQMPLPA